jgi:acyl phosphate:glycerol-3-phosphate acyltransferase
MSIVPYSVIAVLSFLLGSIPNGYLVARAKGIDIREHGSKNIGATNVLRVLGKGPGYTVFALDALKGIAAVLLGGWIGGWRADHLGEIIGGVGCILGHSYTPWLGFKGGKGVATTAGVLLTLFPLVLVAVLAVWLLCFYTLRYVSLASMVAAAAMPLAVWAIVVRRDAAAMPLLVFSIVIGLLIIVRHQANIGRLLKGTETRFAKKGRETK